MVEILGKAARAFGYDEVASVDNIHTTAVARLSLEDGTRLTVTDSYGLTCDDALRLSRKVEVTEIGTAAGLRIGFSTESEVSGTAEQDWQFFIPGTLYNRNDNDGDGVEDYLGTYVQDVRDDKNGVLGVLARDPRSGATFTVARVSKPTFDTAITAEQLAERYFVLETDIGSLGLTPTDGGQVALRGSYPFAEEYSFSLDTDRSGWAG